MELNIFGWILVAVLSCAAGYFWLASVIVKEGVKNFFLCNQFFLHPNSICVERVVIAWLGLILYNYDQVVVGICLFTFSAFLDAVDGLVARACSLETERGKEFDPLCDKMTVLPALLYFSGSLIFLDSSMLKREILLSNLVMLVVAIEFFGQYGARFILKKLGWNGAANNWGKMKTMLYFCLITFCALVDNEISVGFNLNNLLLACIGLSIASIVFKFIPAKFYADMLSGLNLICGIIGIVLAVFGGTFTQVVFVIIIGQIFDLLDGKCAQKYGGTRIGPTLDTIADSISFGVCPLVWYWINQAPVSGTIFGVAIVFRLYRYMRDKKSGASCETFIGLPSPGGAMLAFGVWPILSWSNEMLVIAMLTVSYLTVSRIRLSHLGRVVLKRIPRPVFVAMGAMMIMSLVYIASLQSQIYLGWFLIGMTSLYIGLASVMKTA